MENRNRANHPQSDDFPAPGRDASARSFDAADRRHRQTGGAEGFRNADPGIRAGERETAGQAGDSWRRIPESRASETLSRARHRARGLVRGSGRGSPDLSEGRKRPGLLVDFRSTADGSD